MDNNKWYIFHQHLGTIWILLQEGHGVAQIEAGTDNYRLYRDTIQIGVMGTGNVTARHQHLCTPRTQREPAAGNFLRDN